MIYKYIGNTESMFDKRGMSTESNYVINSLDDVGALNIDEITKDEFISKVALPYTLGFLTSNEDIIFGHDPKNDLILANDKYDNETYFFKQNG